MYKLVLCLRYLRSKLFAYFAVLGVALSVWMMLVSVSVMTGFLHKIETAAKGLFGDIVIESDSERGIAWYDDCIKQMVADVPDVQAAEPFVLSVGMLRVAGDRNYRQLVQIAGIRLPGRVDVSDFEKGLYVQHNNPRPTWDPPIAEMIAGIHRQQDEMRDIIERDFKPQMLAAKLTRKDLQGRGLMSMEGSLQDASMDIDKQILLRRLGDASWTQTRALLTLMQVEAALPLRVALEKKIAEAKKAGASATALDDLEVELEDLNDRIRFEGPAHRVILGMGIPGLSFKTPEGEPIRYILPGHRITLAVAPLGRAMGKIIEPNIRHFTVIDDCKTDVSSIDKKLVYVPFATLQKLNHMDGEIDEESGEMLSPPRCSQIHVKVRGKTDELQLRRVAKQIRASWDTFVKKHEDKLVDQLPVTGGVNIETWRQRQSHVVGPIEQQRTLVGIIMAIMSLVAVALIFVILYTIVMQKTREVGVLKAVGASSWGVATLFFIYGAVIGLIGSVVGIIAGVVTVRNINHIQDWADRMFGFRVWTKESFMFEQIPNEVDWNMAVYIVGGSILAGLIGALVPAIRAGRMQPVEALRYE